MSVTKSKLGQSKRKIMEEKNHQKIIFDDEARRKFYAAELESGEHFLYNGKICHSNVMSKEGLDQLKNAEFPKNAVTVLGKIILIAAKLKSRSEATRQKFKFETF